MWLRNREIHERSRWAYWPRRNWWVLVDGHAHSLTSIRIVRDEDMPWELKPEDRDG